MTETSISNKTEITLEGDCEMVIKRTFNAPRRLVFQAWTEPESIKQWWGPRTWPVAICTVDLRVGGRWHYCMRGPDGDESWGIGVYKVIDEPKQLLIEDYFSDADGTLVPPPMIMEANFEELPGDCTAFVGRAIFESPAHRKTILAMGMAEGITEGTEQLAELLERQTGRRA
jgi:uncharacterized protein YndB with AHSA1/START domain